MRRLHTWLTSVTMVASYSMLWYTHPVWQPVVSLRPCFLMESMSQSTGANMRHLLKVPSSCRGRVRFSCSSVVRLGAALRIQSVLQCRSGSDSTKRKLQKQLGIKKLGKDKPSVISFWKRPKSPMVLRIFPKSTIFTQQVTREADSCWLSRVSDDGGNKCLTV